MIGTSHRVRYKGVLIELKNTVVQSSMENIQLPANTVKSILYCGATVEFQCGRITQEQYFSRLTSDFGHSREAIEAAILAMRMSLRVNEEALKSLASIKAQSQGQFKFYAVTNLSQQDYAFIKTLGVDWSLFDQVFVSSEIGMQKPELRFYKRVLDQIGLQAEQVILVDDDTDNVLAAMSMGMQGVLSLEDCMRWGILNSIEADPITQGTQFLRRNARNFPSYTHTGIPVKENFAQLLILELTGDR
jgi:FMN phosphatase YigB (HAD superfamily)